MKALTKKEVLQIGTFDKGGRFYLYSDFETATSRAGRGRFRYINIVLRKNILSLYQMLKKAC